MTETKFTPGPWVIRSRNNPHEWDVVKFDTPAADDPWFVAAVFDGAEGKLSIDNARLISAAPEMFEALNAARTALLSSKPVMAHYDEPCARHKAAFEAVEAALSKALGKEGE